MVGAPVQRLASNREGCAPIRFTVEVRHQPHWVFSGPPPARARAPSSELRSFDFVGGQDGSDFSMTYCCRCEVCHLEMMNIHREEERSAP